MTLQIPDSVALQADCTPDDLLYGMVVGLFLQGRLSIGQASHALNISKPEFMGQLHAQGLPMPYGAAEAERDLAVIDRLWPHSPPSPAP